ncbi:MAG: hypothetical protein C0483_00685 [Pirellula sp.]|nr:hypothetical protein [Pirellula sp.]
MELPKSARVKDIGMNHEGGDRVKKSLRNPAIRERRCRPGRRFLIVCIGILVPFGNGVTASAAAAPDFEREVRPIFSAHCVKCHGAEKSQGGLRLDSAAGAFLPTDSGTPAIVPHKADESELLSRVSAEDADLRMPPEGDPLSVAEVDVLRRWIAAGAAWPAEKAAPKHWAWVAPTAPKLPRVQSEAWVRNPIDRFILARLEQEKLAPSPEADAAALCRRLHFDLIGLPPSPGDIAEFVAACDTPDRDKREQAYAALVDKLLASPQFGERWARHWLDLARYADSNGFQRDGFRTMWAYRDWVVEAFNQNLPFDRFVVEQMAGDLLPNATDASRIATGFHRCTTVNVEAGTDPEENRVLAVVDRVNTTGTVFLGATIACAQCHNHKYDPFTQVDYYRLLAYFNNTEAEITPSGSSRQFTGPKLALPMSAEQEARRRELAAQLKELEEQQAARQIEALALEKSLVQQLGDADAGPIQRHVLPIASFDSAGGATPVTLPDNSVLLTEDSPEKDVYTVTVYTDLKNITGFRLEALTDDALPGKGPGRGDAKRPNFVLNELIVRAAPKSDDSAAKAVVLTGAEADFTQASFAAAEAIDGETKQGGWAINPQFHKPHHLEVRTREPIGFDGGTVLTFELHQNYGGSRTIGRLRLSAVTGNSGASKLPEAVVTALKKPAAKRNKAERKAVEEYCLSIDPKMQELRSAMAKTREQLEGVQPPSTLVMVEMPAARTTAVMKRGNFLDLGPTVQPGTPASFHTLEKDAPPNRLGLAQWLVDEKNPLLARVTVNRFWAELFGRGIVATQEDFGAQCEPPTHPELLDWLAVEFEKGLGERGEGSVKTLTTSHASSSPLTPDPSPLSPWNVKALLRQIVLSSTYRQTSRVTPELLRRDPYNLLIARGPRFRLPAETIRDNALAVAGLLNLKQGGPPVYPPQPEGIWRVTGEVDNKYYTSSGEDRYRRGLYTIWRRSAPYPSFVNFDAPERSSCVVQRPRTNTPLQALTLLNDPVYVEAAGALARRITSEAPSADEVGRVEYGFRLAAGRKPSNEEKDVLLQVLRQERPRYQGDLAVTKKLLAAAHLDQAKPAMNAEAAAEWAAWYHVAEILLNLDETITKQ